MTLEIRLLGSPTVDLDGKPVEVDTRKAIAMLAYLVVEGSVDREALAALFWADSAPDRARATLRRTLSALRTGIGSEAIRADRNRVELAMGYSADVDFFNAALQETTTHEHGSSEVCERCVSPLQTATALYRGDFLGAFSIRDAPDFEDWVRPVTESFRLKAGDAFQRLAMARASSGEYTDAIEAASRWIDLDELHEPAYRLLMLLNAWSGDRPGSIEAYRRCGAVLDRELGVAPLEETTELYEAILDEDLPPAPGLRRTVQTVKPRTAIPDEMIDRSDAIGTLNEAVEMAQQGGRVCLVTGDSWMGKTRLLEHLSRRVAAIGRATVTARAFRSETRLPYGVAIQLLDGLVGMVDLEDLPEWAREELARLDPRIAPGQTPSTAERFGELRLRESFLTLLVTVVTGQPTVVAVDDAQWIDPASAALLTHTLRRIGTAPVLFVVAARDMDSLDSGLREVVAEAGYRIHLAPLTADDIRPDYPDTNVDQIIDATGGIPLLVKEALDSGAVAPDSVSVSRYMESRRQRLSELGRQVLAATAVLDGMCDATLLRDTSGRTDDEVVEAVEELVTTGLIREEDDGRIRFTLDVLESVSYESTSLVRRRLLHRRAAEALQTRPRSRTDPRLATATASHLRASGSDEAAEWYRLAGDLARSVFANDEAVNAYENAIALGHRDAGGLHLALGELAIARGDYQVATRELRAAASRSSGSDLALVEQRTGGLHRILGRFELAEESFSRAKADHPSPADLYSDWALLRHRTGDTESARSLADDALSAAEEDHDDERKARSLNILGVVTPDPATAMGYLDEALHLARSTETGRMAALNNKAHLLGVEGDHEAAIGLVREAIDIASRAGYRHQHAALLNHLADLHHASGDENQARAALTEAVTIFADIDAGDWEPEVWLLRQW